MDFEEKYQVNGVSLERVRNRNELRVVKAMRSMLPEQEGFCGCRVCIEDVYAATASNILRCGGRLKNFDMTVFISSLSRAASSQPARCFKCERAAARPLLSPARRLRRGQIRQRLSRVRFGAVAHLGALGMFFQSADHVVPMPPGADQIE